MLDTDSSPGWPSYKEQLFPVLKTFCALSLLAFILVGFLALLEHSRKSNAVVNFAKFFYASFLKPHSGDGEVTGQQSALESFYRAQVGLLFPPAQPSGKSVTHRIFDFALKLVSMFMTVQVQPWLGSSAADILRLSDMCIR